MSKITVRQALEPLVFAWAQANNIAVAWENVSFTPPANGYWVQVTLIPAETVSGSLSATEYKGLLHINLFGPANTGTGQIETHAQSLAGVFYAGRNANGVRITRPPSVGQTTNDPNGYVMTPVKARYQLNTQ